MSRFAYILTKRDVADIIKREWKEAGIVALRGVELETAHTDQILDLVTDLAMDYVDILRESPGIIVLTKG